MNRTHRIIAAAVVALAPMAARAQAIKPLGNITIEVIIGRIISGLFGIMGIAFLATFVYSGVIWMTAGGNADKVKVAKRNIQYAVAGLIVSFSSYAILDYLLTNVLS